MLSNARGVVDNMEGLNDSEINFSICDSTNIGKFVNQTSIQSEAPAQKHSSGSNRRAGVARNYFCCSEASSRGQVEISVVLTIAINIMIETMRSLYKNLLVLFLASSYLVIVLSL